MQLTINGKSRSFENASFTLETLLAELGLTGKPVVIELNREPVFARDYPSTPVPDASELEIVTISAGG